MNDSLSEPEIVFQPTRTVFLGLSEFEIGIWYSLVVISIAVFLWGIFILVRKYLRGRKAPPLNNSGERLWQAIKIVFSHTWIRRRNSLVGVAHLLIFYGFLVLFIGTAILFIQVDIVRPLFGWEFWQGRFYLIYSLSLDLFGLAFLIGLLYMAVRRGIQKPNVLNYSRPDRDAADYNRSRYVIGDWIFLFILFFLVLTGFLLESLRIAATNPEFEKWSPVGWWLGQELRALGMESDTAEWFRHSLWWIHGVVALSFVASIPFTKAMHMLVAPFSVIAKDERAGSKLDPVAEDIKPEEIGYTSIASFTPKHLLSLDACTKCGKCHEACPARAGGYPLSPRDLILDLRELAAASMGGVAATLSLEPGCDVNTSVLGNQIKAETLWSCMQCMACEEICPVGIEHVPIINQMRRALVEEGQMDAQLQSTLETIYNVGNSFGEAKRKRSHWTKCLAQPVKDIRQEPAEYLWFVGDYASFDPRNQEITQATARILQTAGVDFGILFEGERTAGNDVRRVGEEGLWVSLAEENIRTIEKCEFQRILTTDPHTYNTLKNEYPEVGARWSSTMVIHHSELLLEMFNSGNLKPNKTLDYRVTYHDPCHLGRYNGVYEPPRQILKALGMKLVEMPRNRDNSFCCGAGGGRIWMTDTPPQDVQRPSENRIDEAVNLGNIDYFVVACPKDVTMYEDAIKTSGHQGKIALRELTELVVEAMEI